jgi:hypothetical protein
MRREETLDYFEQFSSYCECPQLSDLFEKSRTASNLENRCNFFKSNVDLDNPRPEDRAILKDYLKAVEELENAATSYHQLLYKSAEEGKLTFTQYDSQTRKPIKSLNLKEAIESEKTIDTLITINCTICGTQIDLVEKLSND